MPDEYVVVVSVVVAGAVVVCSVVVVLVCANANGAKAAQASVIIVFFIISSDCLFVASLAQATCRACAGDLEHRPVCLDWICDSPIRSEFVVVVLLRL